MDNEFLQDEINRESDDDSEVPPPTPGETADEEVRDDEPVAGPSSAAEREGTSISGNVFDMGQIISLIETYDETGAGASKNFKKLIEKVEKDMVISGPSPSSQNFSELAVRKTHDMFVELLDTKLSATMVRDRVERMGSKESVFSVDDFMESLKNANLDNGVYSPLLAAANIAAEASTGAKTVTPFVAVVNTFDMATVVEVPKVRKVRAPPLRRSAGAVGGGEIINAAAVVRQPQEPQEALKVNEMLTTVKQHCRQTNEPKNLFELVLDQSSVKSTVENLQYASILAKEGRLSLGKEANGEYGEMALSVKPEKRPENTSNEWNREQHIVSFTPQMWKSLVEAAAKDPDTGMLENPETDQQ